jgi:hypothetical protein
MSQFIREAISCAIIHSISSLLSFSTSHVENEINALFFPVQTVKAFTSSL